MDAGVGAGTAFDVQPLVEHRLHRVLKYSGHGKGIFLHLEPMVFCSLVPDGQQ